MRFVSVRAGSIPTGGFAYPFFICLFDRGAHNWPRPGSMNRRGIASHLKVPVSGALAEHCEASVLWAPALLIRVHLGVERAMSP
jgi:hypothetical protein